MNGHHERDQEHGVPEGWIEGRFRGTGSLGEQRLQGCPEPIGAGVSVALRQSRGIGGMVKGGRIAGIGEDIAQEPPSGDRLIERTLEKREPFRLLAPPSLSL